MKKRFDLSSHWKPPSPLVFFLDRSLGKKVIAARLRQEGAEVQIHDDHFMPNAKDEDWLREVGKRRWVVLTKDRRIRYRTPALAAIRKAAVRVFVLIAGDLQGGEMAEAFVKALPAINRFAAKNRPPFIAKVTKRGTVSMLFSPKSGD